MAPIYRLLASITVLLLFAPALAMASSGEADLAVAKGVDNPTPADGATILYTVGLTNNGPDTATGVQVDDLLPNGVTYVSHVVTDGIYVSSSGVWILGSLDAGASATLTVTATVDPGTVGQTITNTATVAFSDQSDGNAANDTASVDILVTGAAQYDTPGIGTLTEGRAKVVVVVGAGESGAPAGFTVQWMKHADFVANGSVWPDDQDPRRADADFHGEPTLNTWGGALETFVIDPWQTVVVEIGDLFDETGVDTDADGELEMGTKYIFRARANGDGMAGPSPFSPPTIVDTEMNMNCTWTQGYWKNHESAWPTGTVTLGDNTFDQSQLLAILHQPARGNGLIILAHQLIAVELNILQGAIYYDVEDALNEAHTLIGSLIPPPVGSGHIHPREACTLTQILDDFNNGVTGPGHCSVSIEDSSWGRIKAIYR